MMLNLEKINYINQLIDIYGCLLTDKQFNYLEAYYKDDLSYQEIADNYSVSKNAIHDSIQKAIALLEHYELKLQLYDTMKRRVAFIEQHIQDPHIKKELLELELI